MYSMKNIDGKESNTAKGVNIATEFNEFKATLFIKKNSDTKWEEFKPKNTRLGYTKSTKNYCCVFMIKRFALDDGIHTPAYFHKDIDLYKWA